MHLGPVRGPSAAEHSGSLLQLGPLYLYYTSDKAKGWPLVDIAMTCKLADEYITQDAGRFNTLRNLPSCAEPLSQCEAPDDLAVVFHMGESVRGTIFP